MLGMLTHMSNILVNKMHFSGSSEKEEVGLVANSCTHTQQVL